MGKVVCTQKKMPSRRSTKLRLYADTGNVNLVADGSDFIVVVAEVTDDNGNVRRLAKENIVFTVEGEGGYYWRCYYWCESPCSGVRFCPVLIRSTRKAGKIKVKAVCYLRVHKLRRLWSWSSKVFLQNFLFVMRSGK